VLRNLEDRCAGGRAMRANDSRIYQDAATLRGIAGLLEDGPESMFEIEMTLHLGYKTAKRLCGKFET